MKARGIEFLRRGVSRIRREENASRGNPPAAVSIQVHVSAAVRALAAEHAGGVRYQRLTVALENLRQQSWCEGKLKAFAGQRQSLKFTKRQESGQVILAVERARLLDQAAIWVIGRRSGCIDVFIRQIVLAVACSGYLVRQFLKA